MLSRLPTVFVTFQFLYPFDPLLTVESARAPADPDGGPQRQPVLTAEFMAETAEERAERRKIEWAFD
eukprot:9262657-Pyramimonas_sp.AAC.1